MWTRSALALAIVLAGAAALAAQSPRFGVGRPPTPDEVRGLGAAIAPDGGGLPDGSGSVAEGRTVYAARCASCHGPSGAGIPAQYPRLSGQHADYVEAQLVAFRGGVRRNNPAMAAIAAKLGDREIKAVADYVAGLR